MGVKRTILVVEDEKDIRELVRFHLEQEGYAVREADSGERALQQIASERPALVVLDDYAEEPIRLPVVTRERGDS